MVSLWLAKNLISLEKPLCKRPVPAPLPPGPFSSATPRPLCASSEKVTRKLLCKLNEFLIVKASRTGCRHELQHPGHFVREVVGKTRAVSPSRCFRLTLFCPLIVPILDAGDVISVSLFVMSVTVATWEMKTRNSLTLGESAIWFLLYAYLLHARLTREVYENRESQSRSYN